MHNICTGFDIKCKNSSVYVYCNESTNPEDLEITSTALNYTTCQALALAVFCVDIRI